MESSVNPAGSQARPIFSMDLCEPYCVYVDGVCVGEFSTEDEAADLFCRLRGSKAGA